MSDQPTAPYTARTRTGGSTSVIVTWRGEDFVEAVVMSSGPLDVTRFDARDFDARFEPYEYDTARAAAIYLAGRKPETGVTAAAREALSNIINHQPQGAPSMTKPKSKTPKKSNSTGTGSISKEMREKMDAVGKGAAEINRKAKEAAKPGKITPTAGVVPPAKPVKHAPAGAPTRPTKAPRALGSRLKLDLAAKITVVSKANPKREGSGANKRFALYKTGMTVAEFLKAGGIPADVHWDSKQNFIKLSK